MSETENVQEPLYLKIGDKDVDVTTLSKQEQLDLLIQSLFKFEDFGTILNNAFQDSLLSYELKDSNIKVLNEMIYRFSSNTIKNALKSNQYDSSSRLSSTNIYESMFILYDESVGVTKASIINHNTLCKHIIKLDLNDKITIYLNDIFGKIQVNNISYFFSVLGQQKDENAFIYLLGNVLKWDYLNNIDFTDNDLLKYTDAILKNPRDNIESIISLLLQKYNATCYDNDMFNEQDLVALSTLVTHFILNNVNLYDKLFKISTGYISFTNYFSDNLDDLYFDTFILQNALYKLYVDSVSSFIEFCNYIKTNVNIVEKQLNKVTTYIKHYYDVEQIRQTCKLYLTPKRTLFSIIENRENKFSHLPGRKYITLEQLIKERFNWNKKVASHLIDNYNDDEEVYSHFKDFFSSIYTIYKVFYLVFPNEIGKINTTLNINNDTIDVSTLTETQSLSLLVRSLFKIESFEFIVNTVKYITGFYFQENEVDKDFNHTLEEHSYSFRKTLLSQFDFNFNRIYSTYSNLRELVLALYQESKGTSAYFHKRSGIESIPVILELTDKYHLHLVDINNKDISNAAYYLFLHSKEIGTSTNTNAYITLMNNVVPFIKDDYFIENNDNICKLIDEEIIFKIIQKYSNLLYQNNLLSCKTDTNKIRSVSSLLYKAFSLSIQLYNEIYYDFVECSKNYYEYIPHFYKLYLEYINSYRELYKVLFNEFTLSNDVKQELDNFINGTNYSKKSMQIDYRLYYYPKKILLKYIESENSNLTSNDNSTNLYDNNRFDTFEEWLNSVDPRVFTKEIYSEDYYGRYITEDNRKMWEYVKEHLHEEEEVYSHFSSFFEETYNMCVVYYLTSLTELAEILDMPNLLTDSSNVNDSDDTKTEDVELEDIQTENTIETNSKDVETENLLPGDTANSLISAKSSSKQHNVEDVSSGGSPSPTPKKRGRKKKSEVSSEPNTQLDTKEHSIEETTPKKRGRKKKVVTKDSTEDSSSQIDTTLLEEPNSGKVEEQSEEVKEPNDVDNTLQGSQESELIEERVPSGEELDVSDNVETKLKPTNQSAAQINLSSLIGDNSLDNINILDAIAIDNTKPKDPESLTKIDLTSLVGDYTLDNVNLLPSTDNEGPYTDETNAIVYTEEPSTDTDINPFADLNFLGMEVKPLTFGTEEDIAFLMGNVSYKNEEDEDTDVNNSVITNSMIEETPSKDINTEESSNQVNDMVPQAISFGDQSTDVINNIDDTTPNDAATITIPANSSNREVTVHVNNGSKDMKINITFN